MRRLFTWLFDYYASGDISRNSIKSVLSKVIIWTFLITVIVFISLLTYFETNKSFAIFTIVSVIGAYYISGCAIGFIFGIPKSAQNINLIHTETTDGKARRTQNTDYRDNTSLEEISDWITKIIIGLSLTQFHKIQAMIYEAARHIGNALKSTITTGKVSGADYLVFSYAIVVMYGIAGIVTGYLWTRIEFRKILTQNLRELERISKIEEVNENLIRRMNNPDSTAVETSELKQASSSVDADQIALMNKIVATKPVGIDPDDPQKGRWGGLTISNNRRINAEVTVSSIPSLYKVIIKVSSIDNTPILTPVGIVLHDTFEPILRVLSPNGGNEVVVELIAYEAFTAGALCDVETEAKYTQLELDLNQLPNLPQGFYWR